MKNNIIEVQKIKISVMNLNEKDYICISDFTKYKAGKSTSDDIIKNWLRNRITLEFLGTWELIYNSNFSSKNRTKRNKLLQQQNLIQLM